MDTFLKGSPSYYNDDKELPILERISKEKKHLYTVEDIAKLLLNPKLKSSKFVTNKVPTMICSSVSFVVDLDSLDAKEDIMSDDMGVWRNNRTDRIDFEVTFQNCAVKDIRKCSSDFLSPNRYMLKRVYHTHLTCQTLRKITAFIHGTYLYVLSIVKCIL